MRIKAVNIFFRFFKTVFKDIQISEYCGRLHESSWLYLGILMPHHCLFIKKEGIFLKPQSLVTQICESLFILNVKWSA